MNYKNFCYTFERHRSKVGFDKTYPFNQKYVLNRYIMLTPLVFLPGFQKGRDIKAS
jgi:hypothetical protein